MEVYYYASFSRQLKKLPKSIRETVIWQTKLFIIDPHHPSLKLHKLQGHLRGYYAFWVDFRPRIILEIQADKAYFHAIGDHSVYDE